MLGRCPRVQLVAGSSRNPANRAAFTTRFGVPCANDHRELLAKHTPALACIATYVGPRREIIEDCVRAGVRLLICEKPFLASPADLAAVRSLVEATGVRIVVAHIRRHCPAYRRATELYAGGAVGRPVLAMSNLDGWDLSEWGSHHLDLMRFFHRDASVRWVMGQGRVRQARGYGHAMEDHAFCALSFDGGGRACLEAGQPSNLPPFSISLMGEIGVIQVNGDECTLSVTDARGRHEERLPHAPSGGGWNELWDLLLRDLLDWADGGPAPELGVPNQFATSELNLATYVSMLRGDRIDLPLETDLNEWPLEAIARRAQSDMRA
jgi:predicted dehydrogenase